MSKPFDCTIQIYAIYLNDISIMSSNFKNLMYQTFGEIGLSSLAAENVNRHTLKVIQHILIKLKISISKLIYFNSAKGHFPTLLQNYLGGFTLKHCL